MIFDPPPTKKRLDMFLTEQYPAVSRSFLQRLCTTDQVLVNGQPEKAGFKLKLTDKVTVLYDMASMAKIEDIELNILYQDENILVIDKPTGVISHARGRFWNEPSVASFVRQVTGQDGERAGIVHRLDRATSGVMVCAKNSATMSFLQKQFAARTVQKKYIAIVSGHMKVPEAIIDMPIERNPKAPSTFRVGSNGKPAQTLYKVLKSSHSLDELELLPKTGRTHQLRVHLAYQGHPIVGDELYGGQPADRLYLHAEQIILKTPDGQVRTFTSELPLSFTEQLRD